MNESSKKMQAEELLRELPSILAASVREDVEGNPREIHLLVSPGPEVRQLAREVRGVLETRLGIAIDQRIISIAQLTDGARDWRAAIASGPEAPAAQAANDDSGPETVPAVERGLNEYWTPDSVRVPVPDPVSVSIPDREPAVALPSEPPSVRDVAPGVEPQSDADSVPASSAEAGTAVPGEVDATSAAPRLTFARIEGRFGGGETRTRVRLAFAGESFDAESRELDTPNGRIRAAAAAALGAATAACRGEMEFHLEGASIARVFDRDVVLVSVLAASALLGRIPMPLVGAHQVGDDPEEAAVLAALKSIDRVATLGLERARR